MSTVPLPPILAQVLPILKMLGIDPAKLANNFGRKQVGDRLAAQVTAVAARLEADLMTPARKGDSPEAERAIIRSAMYLLFKGVLVQHLPQVASKVADALRDAHDDAVVARVAPQIDHNTSTAELVQIVAVEIVERIF